MAEQIEHNGVKFYSLVAGQLNQFHDLFAQLAREEKKHLAIFTGMRKKLSAADRESTAYDPDSQNNLYLQALADREVFKTNVDPRKILPSAATLAQVIDLAIGKEKDSIVFYVGARELVPEKLGREKINSIIAEEYGHIAFLRGITLNR
jgi:rubrerythrin